MDSTMRELRKDTLMKQRRREDSLDRWRLTFDIKKRSADSPKKLNGGEENPLPPSQFSYDSTLTVGRGR